MAVPGLSLEYRLVIFVALLPIFFSNRGGLLSFHAMPRADLGLPPERDGGVWLYRSAPAAPLQPHRHDELEVNLVTAGRACYLVEDHRYDLSPGTQIWLFPAQDHVLIEGSPDYAMWIGVFKPAMLRRICTDAVSSELRRAQPTGMICKQLPTDLADDVERRFHEVDRAADESALHNAALAHLCLAAWSAHRRAESAPPGRDVHPAVERAARLIRDETEPLNVDELAQRAGLSASRLTRLFKQQTGVSLTQYRQRQQLQRFLDLYGRGRRRNITECALAAGFGSYAQFHRVFKQQLGCSPAVYRRRLQVEQV